MQISSKPAFIPNRALVVKPAPVAQPAPGPETSRFEEQQQAAKDMLGRLASDARLAAIMFNPVFAPHANAIAWAATGRAIHRYETEVPRKDFDTLMAEEQTRARQEIMGLPRRYGNAIETGAQAAGDAVVTGAKATGNFVVRGAKAVGEGVVMAGGLVIGGLVMGGKAVLHGLGTGLSGLGNLLQSAGSTIEKSSQ